MTEARFGARRGLLGSDAERISGYAGRPRPGLHQGRWMPSLPWWPVWGLGSHSPGFIWQGRLLPEIDQGSVASWRGTGAQAAGAENSGVPVGLLVPAPCILQTFQIPSGVCPPPMTAHSLRECPAGAQQATPKWPSLARLECVAKPSSPDRVAGTSAPSDEGQ